MTRQFCLAWGVGRYQSDDVTPLVGPPNDVAAIRGVFADRGWTVLTLVDEQATKDEIKRSVLFVRHAIGPGDRLRVFISSHGISYADDWRMRQGFVPYDYQPGDHGTLISGSELGDWLTPVGAHDADIGVLVDACYSGGAVRAVGSPDGVPKRIEAKGPPVPPRGIRIPRYVTIALEQARVVCLAACRSDQVAIDGQREGKSGGAFTFGLLAALATAQPPNTWAGVAGEADGWLKANLYDQEPTLTGPVKRFTEALA